MMSESHLSPTSLLRYWNVAARSARFLIMLLMVCAVLAAVLSFRFSFWAHASRNDSGYLIASLHRGAIDVAFGWLDPSGRAGNRWLSEVRFELRQNTVPSEILFREPLPNLEGLTFVLRKGRHPWCSYVISLPLWFPAIILISLQLARRTVPSKIRGFDVVKGKST